MGQRGVLLSGLSTPPPCVYLPGSSILVSLPKHAFLCQANKIMEHRRKYERKREEKLVKERQERIKKAREEHARAQKVRNRRSEALLEGKSFVQS